MFHHAPSALPSPSHHRRSPGARASPGKQRSAKRPGPLGSTTSGVGPQKLFGDLMSKNVGASSSSSSSSHLKSVVQTPGRRALGDKTNASPGTLQGAAPSPSKAAGPSVAKAVSPTKTRSPLKPSGSGAQTKLRPSTTKRRSVGPKPSDAPASTAAAGLVTPAQNVGRAGALRAKMGELRDRDRDRELVLGRPPSQASLREGPSEADARPEETVESVADQVPIEEAYPEIEYMPPSNAAQDPPWELPDELADVPRASEISRLLSAGRSAGFYRPRPDSPPELLSFAMNRSASPELRAIAAEGAAPLPGLDVGAVGFGLEGDVGYAAPTWTAARVDNAVAKPSASTTAAATAAAAAARPAPKAASTLASRRPATKTSMPPPSTRPPAASKTRAPAPVRPTVPGRPAALSGKGTKRGSVVVGSSGRRPLGTRPGGEAAAPHVRPPAGRRTEAQPSHESAAATRAAAAVAAADEDELERWAKRRHETQQAEDLAAFVGLDLEE